MHKLSVVIITKNEELNIGRCLGSVKEIADEIVVVDDFSTDKTAQICHSYGCRVIERKFTGFSDQKQFAVDQAVNDWVFSLDADEEVTAEMRTEITSLFRNDVIPFIAYKTPRSLFYMGRILRYSGVGEKPVLRIFNKNKGRFNGLPVHEEIVADGPAGVLKSRMIHYSYRDLSHHLEKSNIYTTHAAEGYFRTGKNFTTTWTAFKFPVNFFLYYIIKRGFMDGFAGFMWSFLAAFYGSIKMAKTIEKRKMDNLHASADV
jgi:glycosyltransferase involved in cell wall biosynthesis